MGKAVKSVTKVFGGGGVKIDNSAAIAAAKAQQAANNMAKNFKADLATENMATVLPGATADATQTNDPMRKRRVNANTLSTQLGINA